MKYIFFIITTLITFIQIGEVNGSSLYVADSETGNIYTLNSNLNFSIFAKDLGNPTNIHFDSEGILHYWDYQEKSLFSYSSDFGKKKILNIPGSTISDYAFDNENNIYLADINLRQLIKYDFNGSFVSKINDIQIGAGVVIDSNNQVYVGGVGDHNIHIYDQNLQKLSYVLGAGSSNPRPKQTNANGDIFAVSGSDGKVLQWSTTSNGSYVVDSIIEEIWWPRDVAVDPLGQLYVAATFPGNTTHASTLGLSIFDSSGVFQTRIGSDLFSSPDSLEFGPTQTPIPEPSTLILLVLGLCAFAVIRSRKAA